VGKSGRTADVRRSPGESKRKGTLEVLGMSMAVLWSLLASAFFILVIVVWIWGGTNGAHLDCLKHRLGDNGAIPELACAVEH
jgi:hypothetical protein